MPRKKRTPSPTGIYHWITRGINKRRIFHVAEDFEFFKSLLVTYKCIYQIKIYHYCLMDNHIHLMIYADELDQIAWFSHYVLRKYTYYFCGKYKHSGSLFQKGYKSLPIEKESYLLECARYIERNPLIAHITLNLADYPHSSYRYYEQFKLLSDPVVNDSPAFLGIHENIDIARTVYKNYTVTDRLAEQGFSNKELLILTPPK